jgi:pimeloyl-ACP methyl ester carboxylesterase
LVHKDGYFGLEGRDPEVNDKVSPAQIEAMDKWGVQQEGSYDYVKTIRQPTLVVNGSNDVIMPTISSFIMEQNILNAQLVIYPDSNHGSQFQISRALRRSCLDVPVGSRSENTFAYITCTRHF